VNTSTRDGHNGETAPAAIDVRVQLLPEVDRTLVLGGLAEMRAPDGRFAPADIAALRDAIGLPRPSHPSNALASLARRGMAASSRARGRWRLTPLGRERSGMLVTTDDMLTLARKSAVIQGSAFAGTVHPTLPSWLAPPDLEQRIHAFLQAHPFSRNVFAMTRYPEAKEDEQGSLVGALAEVRQACALHGLELHLASDRTGLVWASTPTSQSKSALCS